MPTITNKVTQQNTQVISNKFNTVGDCSTGVQKWITKLCSY
jgi:hypothetical protein